ncbi:MAG: Outer membrane protein [uncultured bacterium]|nr:MAG: Outer membrane protein [uncultured bacterium]
MKKFLLAISMIALFTFGITAFAETKIAVLDLNKVMMDSPQLEKAKTSLKNKFEAREKEIVAAQKVFQSDIDALNKNGPTMKPDDQKKAQQKIMDQQKKLQDMQTKFQNDLNTAQGDAMKTIVKKIEGIVNKIATDKKFDLIIAKAGTAYNKPELEITNDVIKEMKK